MQEAASDDLWMSILHMNYDWTDSERTSITIMSQNSIAAWPGDGTSRLCEQSEPKGVLPLCLLHLRDLRLQRSHHDFCSLLSLQRSLVVAQSFLNLESLNQENTSTLEAAHGCILHGGLCFPDMPKSSLLCDLATTTKRDGARCRGMSFSSVPGRVRVPRALHAKSSPRRASSP